jgi:hypothetical protein
MISYQIYKILHLTGIFMIVISLGGMAVAAINGGVKNHPFRKQLAWTHGIGMVLALVAGFGLLARLGLQHGEGLPVWVIAKLVIWFVLGGIVSLFIRQAKLSKVLWLVVLALAISATYLAGYKPI